MEEERREYRRLVLSSIDLDQAIEWVDLILGNQLYRERDEKERAISRGLQTAMVVAYSRPFSGNDERKHTTGKLRGELLDVFDKDEKTIHSRVLKLRHKVFAHTDSEVRDLKVNVASVMGIPFAMPLSHNPFVSMSEAELVRFRQMARKLSTRIAEELTKVQERLSPGDEF